VIIEAGDPILGRPATGSKAHIFANRCSGVCLNEQTRFGGARIVQAWVAPRPGSTDRCGGHRCHRFDDQYEREP
jgi:hypothetical protein